LADLPTSQAQSDARRGAVTRQVVAGPMGVVACGFMWQFELSWFRVASALIIG